MSTFESARFYVIDTPQTTLSDLARQLYGDAGSLLASDFQRLNATATDSAGQMRKGQLVFLPDPVCYRPDVEADIVHTITRVNILVREQMTLAERQLLARQPQLLNNAASGNGIESSVRLANTAPAVCCRRWECNPACWATPSGNWKPPTPATSKPTAN